MNIPLTLAVGVLRGHWTLEDLDTPSPHYRDNLMAQERLALAGKQPLPRYRNLAREWIKDNQQEWELMLAAALEAEPAVPAVASVAEHN